MGRLSPPGAPGTSLALLRYHWSSSVRLSWRLLTPILVLVSCLLLVQADQLPSYGDRLVERSWSVRILLVLVLAAAVPVVTPRLRRGYGGWMNQLPVRQVVQRRLQTLAGALALLPIAALILFLFAAGQPTLGEFGVFIVGLLLALVGVGQRIPPLAPGRELVTTLVGWGSAVVALTPDGTALAVAALLLLIADRSAGVPITMRSRAPRWSLPRLSDWARTTRAAAPSLSGALAVGGFPLLAGFAFLTNNDLEITGRQLGSVLAGGFSVAVVVATLAEALRRYRPPWPWLRSLPVSSYRRVAVDAAWLLLWCLPTLVVSYRLERVAVVPVAALALAASAFGAMAVRCRPGQFFGSSGEVLLWNGLLTAFSALLPGPGTLFALLLTPLFLAAGAARERRFAVGIWRPSQHHSVGDSLDVVS